MADEVTGEDATRKLAQRWIIAGALLLIVLLLAAYLLAPPSQTLVGESEAVRAYIIPANYKRGEIVTLRIKIGRPDAKKLAIRQVTLGERGEEPLLETARFFEDPPWSDTIWGDETEIAEEYEFVLPRTVSSPLYCELLVDYVEGTSLGAGRFVNKSVFAEVPVMLFEQGRE